MSYAVSPWEVQSGNFPQTHRMTSSWDKRQQLRQECTSDLCVQSLRIHCPQVIISLHLEVMGCPLPKGTLFALAPPAPLVPSPLLSLLTDLRGKWKETMFLLCNSTPTCTYWCKTVILPETSFSKAAPLHLCQGSKMGEGAGQGGSEELGQMVLPKSHWVPNRPQSLEREPSSGQELEQWSRPSFLGIKGVLAKTQRPTP